MVWQRYLSYIFLLFVYDHYLCDIWLLSWLLSDLPLIIRPCLLDFGLLWTVSSLHFFDLSWLCIQQWFALADLINISSSNLINISASTDLCCCIHSLQSNKIYIAYYLQMKQFCLIQKHFAVIYLYLFTWSTYSTTIFLLKLLMFTSFRQHVWKLFVISVVNKKGSFLWLYAYLTEQLLHFALVDLIFEYWNI